MMAPRRTRIKVCGMGDPDEVMAVAATGVDAMGFIFAEKSPRRVHPDLVRELVASLPPFVDAVGVFLDHPVAEVNRIVGHCGLHLAQLHGNESPAFCAAVDCKVIKVFRVQDGLAAADLAPYTDRVAAFLFDTFNKDAAGGTGQVFDWRMLHALAPQKPMILAGGLSPENAAEAVRHVRPFALDFNSGLESAPGRKNIELVRAAVAAVLAADRSEG